MMPPLGIAPVGGALVLTTPVRDIMCAVVWFWAKPMLLFHLTFSTSSTIAVSFVPGNFGTGFGNCWVATAEVEVVVTVVGPTLRLRA